MQDSNAKKRPRSSSPPPSASPKPGKALSTKAIELSSQLKQPRMRNAALNELMKVTATHDVGFSINGEVILPAVVDLFFELIGWSDQRPTQLGTKPIFSAVTAWTVHATPEDSRWASFCATQLAKGKLGVDTLKSLEAIVMVLRNLSFAATNHRLMAYSPDVLTVLTGALYETTANNVGTSDDAAINNNTCAIATHAMHALVNLAQYLDVTGQKLLCDKLFLVDVSMEDGALQIPNRSSFGQVADGKFGFGSIWLAKRMDTKEDFVADVPRDVVLELVCPYMQSVWAIFPAVKKVFTDPSSPRQLTMMVSGITQVHVIALDTVDVTCHQSQSPTFVSTRLWNLYRSFFQGTPVLLPLTKGMTAGTCCRMQEPSCSVSRLKSCTDSWSSFTSPVSLQTPWNT